MLNRGISLKHLEIFLSQIEGYSNPQIDLEQYITPPKIASDIIYYINSEFGDIKGKTILDLGCGTGMLTLAAKMMGCSFIIGIDVCPISLYIAKKNLKHFGLTEIDFFCCDVNSVKDFFIPKHFDVVIMNPPFGTKHNTGIDIKFLETSLFLSPTTIYSLHKRSTRSFLKKFGLKNNLKTDLISEINFNIDHTFYSHKRSFVDIEVDLLRFELNA